MNAITALSPSTYLPIPPAALATADPQLPHNIQAVATRILQILQTIFPSSSSKLSELILDYLITPLPSHQDIYEQMRNNIVSFRTVLMDCFQELLSSRKELTDQESLRIRFECLDLISDYFIIDIKDIYIKAGMLDVRFCYVPKALKSYILTPKQKENQMRLHMNDVISRFIREFFYANAAILREIRQPFTLSQLEDVSDCQEGQIGNYTAGIFQYSDNQDEIKARLLCKELPLKIKDKEYRIPFFGLFEGHRGINAVEYVFEFFTSILVDALQKYNPHNFDTVGIYNALKRGCVQCNHLFRSTLKGETLSRAMLLFVIEVDNGVYIVNMGDSRALLYNRGMLIPLTEDTVFSTVRFAQGVKNRQGWGAYGQALGLCDETRAITGVDYGEYISARPKITMLPRSFFSEDAVLVLACGKIFEMISSKQLLAAIEAHHKMPPGELAKSIAYSVRQIGSQDPISTLVIRFNESTPKDIVQKNYKPIAVFKRVLQDILPEVILEMITDYLIIDIISIYKKKSILIDYLPKPLQSSILTRGERDRRLCFDVNDVGSRLFREFLYAYQAGLSEPLSPSFKWCKPTHITPHPEQSIGNYTTGTYENPINDEAFGERRLIHLLCKELPLKIKDKEYRIPFFGLFRGHQGIGAVEYVSAFFTTSLLEALQQYNPDKFDITGMYNALKMSSVNCRDSFYRTQEGEAPSGATLLFVIEVDNMVYIVNIGNSRAILYNRGMFIQLTEDANPWVERFKQGMKKRGIERIGEDEVARAIGSRRSEMSGLSARPKITMFPRSFFSEDAVLVLACEEVFRRASTNQLLAAIEAHHKMPPGELALSIAYSAYQSRRNTVGTYSTLVIKFNASQKP